MASPLALDIDGTLTTPSGRIDPRVFERLPTWDAPIVVTTGKSFPYPVALCHFLGIPEYVVAENGGVIHADGVTEVRAEPVEPTRVAQAYRERGGHDPWGPDSTVNRWRETEVAFPMDADESLLRELVADSEATVLDTGFAYHVTGTATQKGDGLAAVCEVLDVEPSEFVAIGDSENDVSTFKIARESFAVGNADDRAQEAADHVLDEEYASGFLSVLDTLE
ncbi:MAG: phosphoglycolate phosphatase [uncultured archaeon A07HR60]|jgi:HAD-superfamily hydrolase, subfamily IIB|nr:MAG: phosphoglycolate phosphatase [uncultured archaeon A07HR60]